MLRSRREPPSARVPLLEQALAVADAAGDRTNQVTVLTRLVDAHWARGDRMATLGALERLADLAGADAAACCLPARAGRRLHGHRGALIPASAGMG